MFTTDENDPNSRDLFSVSVTGGTPARVNPPLAPFGNVLKWAVSGENVYYIADQTTNGSVELFAARPFTPMQAQ